MGRPLLVHTTSALLRSALVGDVVVLAPPAGDHDRVRRSLGITAVDVAVQPATARTLADLVGAARGQASALVVHDALVPLAPPSLIDELVAAVSGGAGLALPVRPVTDALKEVRGDRVVGRADRAQHRMVYRPHVYSAPVAARLVAGMVPGAEVELEELLRSGLAAVSSDHVVTVTAPEETFRLTTLADCEFAEAMLAVRRG